MVVFAVVLAACGGSGGSSSTTVAAAGDTTTTQAGGDDGGGGGGDEGGGSGSFNLSPECEAAFVDYLQQIEPIVEDVDWENATASDLEDLGLDEIDEAYTDDIDALNCDDIDFEGDSDDAFDYMISIAERNAPGTVGYLEWIRAFVGSFEGGDTPQASGDCDTDIAAMQVIVDQGGTMSDLPIAELTEATTLLAAISMECPPEKSAEFLSKADVAAFLETAG
jgi:hypothetical protein